MGRVYTPLKNSSCNRGDCEPTPSKTTFEIFYWGNRLTVRACGLARDVIQAHAKKLPSRARHLLKFFFIWHLNSTNERDLLIMLKRNNT